MSPSPPASPPLVVLSYGLGVDSTAILLRWLTDPSSRDFALHDLIVVTAMTGNEWPITGELVSQWILPLLAAHAVRYVQIARAGPRVEHGITILDDSRTPERLYLDGAYTLADEMFAGGTIPQVGGPHKCSQRSKGEPLDVVIPQLTGGRPYRHVVGYELTERGRMLRDRQHDQGPRTGWYPLIEDWRWDRADCEAFIRRTLGVSWIKSACTFCPFALQSAAGRARVLERFADEPAAGAEALLMENVAVSLNPAQGLIPSRNGPGTLLDLLHRSPGQERALEAFAARLDEPDWALYQARRVIRPSKKNPGKAANGVRDLAILAKGTQADARAALHAHADAHRLAIDTSDPRHPRVWHRRRGPTLPAAEWLVTIAPALAPAKTGRGFAKAWNAVLAAPQQDDLLDLLLPTRGTAL